MGGNCRFWWHTPLFGPQVRAIDRSHSARKSGYLRAASSMVGSCVVDPGGGSAVGRASTLHPMTRAHETRTSARISHPRHEIRNHRKLRVRQVVLFTVE